MKSSFNVEGIVIIDLLGLELVHEFLFKVRVGSSLDPEERLLIFLISYQMAETDLYRFL
jgi:hypothetical protein